MASDRLLIRIKGVLPMASTSPFLIFFFFFVDIRQGLVFGDDHLDLRLQRNSENMPRETETEMARAIAPALLTGAI